MVVDSASSDDEGSDDDESEDSSTDDERVEDITGSVPGAVLQALGDGFFSGGAVEDEGEVTDLLNVEISREGNEIVLRQRAYIDKLVTQHLEDGKLPKRVPKTPHTSDISAAASGKITYGK